MIPRRGIRSFAMNTPPVPIDGYGNVSHAVEHDLLGDMVITAAINTDTSALFVSPRETFTPLFDADGNQTLVKTATGIWTITYNGENRPILWERIEQPVLNSLGAYKGGSYSCLCKCGNFGLQSKDYYAPCKKKNRRDEGTGAQKRRVEV